MQHLTPLSTTTNRQDQRLRVREMLRNVRQHQLNQLSAPVDTHNDLASSIQANTSLASAAAFGDTSTRRLSSSLATNNLTSADPAGQTVSDTSTALMIGGGAGVVGAARQSQAAEVCVLVASVAAFTFVFVVVGQCVDVALGDDSDDEQQQPYVTLVCKVVGQMLLNVALLAVPYVILAKYASNSLVCRYYAVVAAFWVVSLHAQTQLRIRFQRVLQGDTKTAAEHKQQQKQNDVHALAKHLADAAEAAKQKEKQRQQQYHDPLHREPMPFVHNAPPPRNERLQPATHYAPHAELLPHSNAADSSFAPHDSTHAMHHAGGTPPSYDAPPVQFNCPDLMQPRETDISELLR